MKKRSVRLLLSLVLFTLSLGSPFSSVIAYPSYSEAAKGKLNKFIHKYTRIISQVQQNPYELHGCMSDIYNYISYLMEKEGCMAAGEFFKDLVEKTDEEQGMARVLRIGRNYVAFSILCSSKDLAGLFYGDQGGFKILPLKRLD